MEDDRISLAHGNGGRFMRELIEEVFAKHLGEQDLDIQADAAPIALNGGDVMITTDGFTVQPLEFPGGDIGSLAVHGTTNDLAVAGARPMYLTLNAFIEEGLEIVENFRESLSSHQRISTARRSPCGPRRLSQILSATHPEPVNATKAESRPRPAANQGRKAGPSPLFCFSAVSCSQKATDSVPTESGLYSTSSAGFRPDPIFVKCKFNEDGEIGQEESCR